MRKPDQITRHDPPFSRRFWYVFIVTNVVGALAWGPVPHWMHFVAVWVLLASIWALFLDVI